LDIILHRTGKSNQHFLKRPKCSKIIINHAEANERKAIMNKTAWRLSRQRNDIEWASFHNPFMSEQSDLESLLKPQSRLARGTVQYKVESKSVSSPRHPLHTVTRVSEHNLKSIVSFHQFQTIFRHIQEAVNYR